MELLEWLATFVVLCFAAYVCIEALVYTWRDR